MEMIFLEKRLHLMKKKDYLPGTQTGQAGTKKRE
jgi:hypothetical protein